MLPKRMLGFRRNDVSALAAESRTEHHARLIPPDGQGARPTIRESNYVPNRPSSVAKFAARQLVHAVRRLRGFAFAGS